MEAGIPIDAYVQILLAMVIPGCLVTYVGKLMDMGAPLSFALGFLTGCSIGMHQYQQLTGKPPSAFEIGLVLLLAYLGFKRFSDMGY